MGNETVPMSTRSKDNPWSKGDSQLLKNSESLQQRTYIIYVHVNLSTFLGFKSLL